VRVVLRIGVIGQSGPISEELRAAAFAVGRAVGARGALLFTGGRDGVMAAASQGAQSAGGVTVGILPGDDLREANPYVTAPVTTGLTMVGRSEVLVHAVDACIIVGGGAGTLAEIAVAYLYRKPLVALRGTGGWGDHLASALVDGRFLDHRRLVPIHYVADPEEAVALAAELAQRGQRPPDRPAPGLGDVPKLREASE